MRTRNGIYYDLTLSCYKMKMKDTGITFVFSSDLHLTKFEEQFEQNRETFNIKMKARYKLNTDFKNYADIWLYKKIETRGFLLLQGGNEICQENLKLGGEIVTPKN